MSDASNHPFIHPVSGLASLEPYFDDLTRAAGNLITAGPEANSHQLLSILVDKVFTCSGAYHLALELEKGGAQ